MNEIRGCTVGGDSPGGPRPLFICGTARSGTTLVASLLDAHPALAVFPGETYFYRLLLDRPLSRITVQAAELLEIPALKAILAWSPVTFLSLPGRSALEERLRQWSQSFGERPPAADEDPVREVLGQQRRRRDHWRAFVELYDRLAPEPSRAKRYWVEKTPSNERFVPLTERFFDGAARYLHILRDPRDVIASWILRTNAAGEDRERTVLHVCYVWAHSVVSALANMKACPGRYHVLKYEHLVQRARVVLSEVVEFLGIGMDEGLLQPTRLGVVVPSNSSYRDTTASAGTLLASQVGRHGEVLSVKEILLVENLIGNQMIACGYPLVALGTPERSLLPGWISGRVRRDIVTQIKVRKTARLQVKFVASNLRDQLNDIVSS